MIGAAVSWIVLWGVATSSSPIPEASRLEMIQRRAAANGLLLVLDGADEGPFLSAVEAARSHPDLETWLLGAIGAEPSHDAGEMAALAKREGWKLEPSWVVLDREGRVVARGLKPPTVDDLLKAFNAAGLCSPDQLIEAFLRQRPDREDARQRRFDQDYRAMLLRLRPLLDTQAPPDAPRLKAPLEGDAEARIFGPCSESLPELMKAEGWRALSQEPMGEFLAAGRYWALSPTLRNLAPRLLSGLEDLLRRYPESVEAWSFWLTLAEATEGASLPDLIETLEPRPGCTEWPPPGPAHALVERAKRGGDQVKAQALLQRRFDAALAEPLGSWGPQQVERQREAAWRGAILPLVDFLLTRGENDRAGERLAQAVTWTRTGYEPYLEEARQMAWTKHHLETAQAWRWLKPAPPVGKPGQGRSDRKSTPSTPHWVVVDEPGGKPVEAFRLALGGLGPAALGLPLQVLQAPKPGSKVQAAPLGLTTGWGVVGAEGKLLAQSFLPPSPEALVQLAEGVGIRSRIAQLEAFRRRHPENQEAYLELLDAHLKLAGKRSLALEAAQGRADEPSGNPGGPPLSEAQDEDLWGPSARLLDLYARDRGFRLKALILEIPPTAQRSGQMRRACARLMPLLETWIERDPRWEMNWANWITLNRLAEPKRSILTLLERCPPLPGSLPGYGLTVTLAFNREARARQQWQAIVDHTGQVWRIYAEAWAEPFPQPVAGSPEAARRLKAAEELLAPLVEAHLKLDQGPAADCLVQELLTLLPDRGLARSLAALAMAAQRRDLASAWVRLVE